MRRKRIHDIIARTAAPCDSAMESGADAQKTASMTNIMRSSGSPASHAIGDGARAVSRLGEGGSLAATAFMVSRFSGFSRSAKTISLLSSMPQVGVALPYLFAAFLFGLPTECFSQAEPLTNEAMQLLELSGLSAQDVEKLLGPPDRRVESASAENWHYGKAVVFFSNGTVAAWTGGEELSQRRVKREYVSEKSGTSEDGYEEGVVSDWRPEANISGEQVISDIVGDSSKAGAAIPTEEAPDPAAALSGTTLPNTEKQTSTPSKQSSPSR